MGDAIPPAETVDARGEQCPMPLLMAKRALRGLPDGAVLEVLSTDPGSERDFQSFARIAGYQVDCEYLPDAVLKLRILKA